MRSMLFLLLFALAGAAVANPVPVDTGDAVGFLSPDGSWAIEPRFDLAERFHDGYAAVKVGGSWCLIDLTGRVVLDRGFEDIAWQSGQLGFAWLPGERTERFYIVDAADGLEVRGPFEGWASFGGPDRVIFRDADTRDCGVVDRHGRVIVEPTHDVLGFLSGGMMLAWDHGVGVGYSDETGQVLIGLQYRLGRTASPNGIAAVQRPDDRRWVLIDRTGRQITDRTWALINPFREGLAAAAVRDEHGEWRWGYIDDAGEWVIEPRFAAARQFSTGLAAVKPPGQERWGYVDRVGSLVIQPRFRHGPSFQGELAVLDALWLDSTHDVVIDREGERVWP